MNLQSMNWFRIFVAFVFAWSSIAEKGYTQSNSEKPVFKIIPTKDNPDKNYVGFQTLDDGTVWFFSCSKKECKPILDRPVPASSFQRLFQALKVKGAKEAKTSVLSDLVTGATKTYVVGTAVSAIIGLISEASLYAFFAPGAMLEGAIGGALMFSLGPLMALTGHMAGIMLLVGVLLIVIVGAVSYTIYKRTIGKPSANQPKPTEVDITHEALILMIKGLAEASTSPVLVMP